MSNNSEQSIKYQKEMFSFANGTGQAKNLQQCYDAGYLECKQEYEEKLRWIPVEEKLPEKIQKQPYITHVVQVKSTTFAEPLCAYYNHDHCVWLSYPFGNSAKLLTVTHWRSFL